MSTIQSGLNANFPVTFAVMNNALWFANGHDPLYLFDGDDTYKAVIERPSTACTAAVNGDEGSLWGSFRYKIAFGREDGQSILGPESNSIDITGGKIDLTDIPTASEDSGVTKRLIYRQSHGYTKHIRVVEVVRWTADVYTHQGFCYATNKLVFEGTYEDYHAAGSPTLPQGYSSDDYRGQNLQRTWVGSKRTEWYTFDGKEWGDFVLVHTIEDNSTTTYTDNGSAAVTKYNPVYPDTTPNTPVCAPFILAGKDRLWLAGGVVYSEGTVSISNGSTTLAGTGTDFQDSMVGKTFKLDTGSQSYEVSSVTSTTELELIKEFEQDTASDEDFTIVGGRSTLWWSEVMRPSEWLPSSFLVVDQDDGDYISAVRWIGDRVAIYKTRSIHTLQYSRDPDDGHRFRVVKDIGAVSHLSVVDVDNKHYFMAVNGFYVFDGFTARKVSQPVDNEFTQVDMDKIPKIHGVHHKKRRAIIWFYVYEGDSECKRAFLYYYETGEWEMLKFEHEIACSCLAVDEDGNDRTYLGDTNGYHWAYDIGYSDGGFPTSTLNGTATSGGNTTLSDSAAAFNTSHLAGASLKILAGTGAGQVRFISEATATQLTVSEAWDTNPDATSVYSIGPIETTYLSPKLDFGRPEDRKKARTLYIYFRPKSVCHYLYVEVFKDEDAEPMEFGVDVDEDGIVKTADASEIKVDMSYSEPVVALPLGGIEFFTLQVRFKWYGSDENPEVLKYILDIKDSDMRGEQ